MDAWARFLDTFFQWVVIERYLPAILGGMAVTVEIAGAVVVTGILLGLSLAVVRTFRIAPLSALPPLVMLLLVYFGLPNVGVFLPSFAVLWLVLSFVLAAFAEEIFWAGILSIPKGQWEAARSTGIGFLTTLAYIVLPQAVRLTVAPPTHPPPPQPPTQPPPPPALARHHQEPRARHRDRRLRNPQPGDHRPILLRQRPPAHHGGDRLRDPVHPRRRARPLARDAIPLAQNLMQALLEQFFDFAIMARALPLVLAGLGQTLVLCLIVVPLGLAGGLLVALTSLSRSRAVRWTAAAAIDFFRAIPPLVLLIFVYAGLPFAGIRLSPLAAVAVAFLLNNSSYYGEIYRAGIESVGRGQWDAARSTGLEAQQALIHVVLPQAVRNVLPDLISNTVEVVKLTSLASVVALPELLYSADMARSITFNTSPIVLAAAIYLAMLWPIVRLVSRLERRIAS